MSSSDLDGLLLSHVVWNSTGKLLAAAVDNMINVWQLTGTTSAVLLPMFSSSLCFVYIFPMRASGRNAPLILLLILALYMYCLLVYLAFFASPLFSLLNFLYLSTSLTFPLRIGPLHFQAGGHKRRPNLGLSCFGLFWVIIFLCSWCMVILRVVNLVIYLCYCIFLWLFLLVFILFSQYLSISKVRRRCR